MAQHDAIDSFISHGTVECRDLAATRRFYEDFLGLRVIQPFSMAIYAEGGGDWRLVCVRSGMKLKDTGVENRFCLHVPDAEAVRRGHEAALLQRDDFQIRHVGAIEQQGDATAFAIQDQDNVWWEISDRPAQPLAEAA